MNVNEQEILSTIALSMIPNVGCSTAHTLLNAMGTATDIFDNAGSIREFSGSHSKRIVESILTHRDEAFRKAEAEMEFAEKGHIRCLTISDNDYPERLRNCDDAPIVLYYRGNANLNPLRSISVVGTRHCTEYGKDICRHLTEELGQMCPDVLVVSGLAYGIDINAHRGCLKSGLKTVGVLAHGLDQIYPTRHRQTAVEMLSQGGLLTEFPHGTFADKGNFVRRNRIVAGMTDACIVVESAERGGSLITARLAADYSRDVFAFPGRSTDPYSRGCNMLIALNKAALIESGADLAKAMRWETQHASGAVQRELFTENLPPQEMLIMEALKNSDGKQINTLSIELEIPVSQLSALLFSLEMKGMIKAMIGGRYRRID